MAEWLALTEGPYAEIFCPANDEEQSQGRVFKAVTKSVKANPGLRNVDVNKSVITFPDGSEIRSLANDYAGIAGANPTASIWDELWGFTTESARRMYDELTPVPTRKNSIRFIVTYAGFEGESHLLKELYDRGMEGERLFDDLPVWVNGGMCKYWDTEPRMPWQTPKYYEEQREDLKTRPNTYRRLHGNEWTSGESSFIQPEEWDALVGAELAPLPPDNGQTVYVGLDGSRGKTKGADHTACVAVRREGNATRLIAHRIWKPTGQGEFDMRYMVLPWLLDLQRKYSIVVMFDPYQLATTAQIARERGVVMHEVPQEQERQTLFTGSFLSAIRDQILRVYPAPDLREQVLNATMKETTRGVRLAKEATSRKIDACVALAMATWAAQHYGRDENLTNYTTYTLPEYDPALRNAAGVFMGGVNIREAPPHQQQSLKGIYGKSVPRYAIDTD